MLTIIIVTFNNEHEIGPCLLSVKLVAGAFSPQIIIIDNASRDQTKNVIQNHSRDISFIANEKNVGFTRAVNQGLAIARGHYLLLLNPDTELLENIFDDLLPIFEKQADVGIVAPQFLNADGSVQPSCRRFPRHRDVFYHLLALPWLFPGSGEFNYWKMGDFDHRTRRFVDQPQGAFLLIRRKTFEEVGLLDERFPMFFSDVDWCHRCINHGWKILFTPEAHIVHLKGRSVYPHRIRLICSSHLSFYRYFRKYYRSGFWGISNTLTGALLVGLAFIRMIIHLLSR